MAERPQVKPNAIFGAILFALLISVGYLFYPQLEMILPFGGQTIDIETHITQAGVERQCENADMVVIATIGDKKKNQQTQSGLSGQEYIVYSEVTLKVQEVLKGSPKLTDDKTMLAYELGGSLLLNQSGRKTKVRFAYEDAATLDPNSTYLLFLDSEGAILNEKYGALLQIDEDYYRDTYQNAHSYDEIKEFLKKEGE